MKRLIISDIHLSEVYGEYFRCILFPFLRHIKEYKEYDIVTFLGDVFDSSTINNETSKLFKELLSIYDDIEVVILNGNHDKINENISIFDILLLPPNVTIIKDVTYRGNNIYIPHINKSVNQHAIFGNINTYIKENGLKEVYLFSHNDFGEMYKFKNNFFNITDTFNNVAATSYFINGHNHVPFFKATNNLYIFNLGCTLNTSFSDSAPNNYFAIIDDEAETLDDKFNIFTNNHSVQYYTFHVWKESHIYEQCKHISKDNYTFIKFKIHDPSIVIDNNFKNSLQSTYNIIDIIIDYEIDELVKLTNNSEDSTSLTDLCEKLNINPEDLMIAGQTATDEKMEILFSLLHLMFENRLTSTSDIETVVKTIKKYMLSNG